MEDFGEGAESGRAQVYVEQIDAGVAHAAGVGCEVRRQLQRKLIGAPAADSNIAPLELLAQPEGGAALFAAEMKDGA